MPKLLIAVSRESFNERAFAGNAKDYHDKTLGRQELALLK